MNEEIRPSPEVLLAQLPVTCVVPNNPAGITSILRAVYGNKSYRDFNEEFFLGWFPPVGCRHGSLSPVAQYFPEE